MRISRVAHVAERYFSLAKRRKILISTIADVTEPYFSQARTRKCDFRWSLTKAKLVFLAMNVPKERNLRAFGRPT